MLDERSDPCRYRVAAYNQTDEGRDKTVGLRPECVLDTAGHPLIPRATFTREPLLCR